MKQYACVMLIFFASLFLIANDVSAQSYDMALGYRRVMYTDWMGFNGQNMIRDSIGWDNPYLLANLPLLHPKNLRYPGGGLANWWDWRKGWFVYRADLPGAYKGLKQLNNSLENYKKVLDACHANA
ncbi:MAG: hypothetical protein ABIQ74_00110, partial [Chitinophagales bacterium]